MKIKPAKSKKRVIIPIVAGLLLAAGLLSYIYLFNGSIFGWNNKPAESNTTTNYDAPTKEQKEAGDEAKKNTAESDKSSSSNTDKPKAPVAPTDNGLAKADVIFTASVQNGDLLQLRVLISAVESTGTCTLTLTNSGKTVTKTADMQAQANTSTCRGFDVPISELGEGSWVAAVSYTGAATKGSATKTIEVK